MHSLLRHSTFLAVILISTVALRAEVDPAAPPSAPHSSSSGAGNSGTVTGIVADPTGAAIVGATVKLSNASSGLSRTTTTGADGSYTFPNLPFNPYRISSSAPGFNSDTETITVRSIVPVTENLTLSISGTTTAVTVEAGGDLIETDPSSHTDVDRALIDQLPLESATSSLSSIVTLTTAGVSADSNGLFHGLGDHAENAFYLDGQPITDQQSKVFSNQIPSDAVQSMEIISGAPPAEFGEKTSLVAVVTTRSGQGLTAPHGDAAFNYGSFGSASGSGSLAFGGAKWGEFFALDAQNTGRFLDPPEFAVFHDHGNEENFFNRLDIQLSPHTSYHRNFQYSRSWFQTPNSYDSLNVTNVLGGGSSATPATGSVGNTDQRSQIGTLLAAPTLTHVLNDSSVVNFGLFVRRDAYNYYPSNNPLADLGPIQQESLRQARTLTNAGLHADYSYVHGAHNAKAGVSYQSTFLNENDALGIVSDTLNSPCTDSAGNPVAGYNSTSQCVAAHLKVNPSYLPLLSCLDLTRPTLALGSGCANAAAAFYTFLGHADIKLLSLFVQDAITRGNFVFNLGLRGDIYNGLSVSRQPEPRVGIAYNIKPSQTVLRLSYARTMETPFNENLVLSSRGCSDAVISALIPCVPSSFNPGQRNEFHAGFQQQIGRHLVVNGEYMWKYTHDAYDFSVLGATPLAFPIGWKSSKIPGYTLNVKVPQVHGFSAFSSFSSVAARFFTPQIGGLGTTVGQVAGPFRIDHDEHYNQTTHLQYDVQHGPARGAWFGFNWRFDSGQVAGQVPCYGTGPGNDCPNSTTLGGQPAINLASFTADQEFQAGLSCNGLAATPTQALPTVCLASQFSSSLANIPAPGAENDDHNPPRIKPRNLFDLSLGDDQLRKIGSGQLSARLTVINLANQYSLYSFLSTFSGTHYVTPRSITAELGFHF
jgi:hypothetical protein